MASETVNFQIGLYSEYWKEAPQVEIFINDTPLGLHTITESKENPKIIKFKHTLEEGPVCLKLKRTGKDLTQTVTKDGEIVKDQVLCIKEIFIDEIDIASLVFHGVYTLEYPEPWATQQKAKGKELPVSFREVTRLGHNGTWEFKFDSPFYMWLLENLY